jgi:hypothetical protein
MLTILEIPKRELGRVLEFFGSSRGQTNDDRNYKAENVTMSERVTERTNSECGMYQTLRRIQTLCSLAMTFVPKLHTSP